MGLASKVVVVVVVVVVDCGGGGGGGGGGGAGCSGQRIHVSFSLFSSKADTSSISVIPIYRVSYF